MESKKDYLLFNIMESLELSIEDKADKELFNIYAKALKEQFGFNYYGDHKGRESLEARKTTEILSVSEYYKSLTQNVKEED